jgi:hypothetical protein
MNRSYTFGFVFLGLGLPIIFGSMAGWWPTMPNVFLYGILTIGFQFLFIGLARIAAGFADDHPATVICTKYKQCLAFLSETWNGAFLPVSLIGIVIILPLLIDEIKKSGPSTYLFFEYPSQLDFANGHLHFTLFAINNTDDPILLDDFRILDIATNTKLYDPYSGFALCSDPKILQFRSMDDQTNPAGSKPITATADKFALRVLKADKVTVGGADDTTTSISLDPRRATRITVAFEAGERKYEKSNTTVSCPSFKVIETAVMKKEVVCPGAIRILFPIAEYLDRTSKLSDAYVNFTWQANSQGFAVIYSTDHKPMHVTDRPEEGYCRSG